MNIKNKKLLIGTGIIILVIIAVIVGLSLKTNKNTTLNKKVEIKGNGIYYPTASLFKITLSSTFDNIKSINLLDNSSFTITDKSVKHISKNLRGEVSSRNMLDFNFSDDSLGSKGGIISYSSKNETNNPKSIIDINVFASFSVEATCIYDLFIS